MRTNGCQAVASAILRELSSRGRSVGWLAQRTGMDRAELVAKLEDDAELTMVDVAGIADVFEIPISELFPAGDPHGTH